MEAKPDTSTAQAPPKIKRPPNSFMLFSRGHRTKLVACCNNRDPDADLLTILTEFAKQTSAGPAVNTAEPEEVGVKKPRKGAKTSHATTPVNEWLANLGLAPDGDWSGVNSVSNSVVSKMLSRQWSYVKLVQPQLAKSYVDAQNRAKTAHKLKYPGYKYKPKVQKTKAHAKKLENKKTKRLAFKLNQQLAKGTVNSIRVPIIILNPTTHRAAELPATTADGATAKVGGAADQAWVDPEPVSPGLETLVASMAPGEKSATSLAAAAASSASLMSAMAAVTKLPALGKGNLLPVGDSYCNTEGLLEVGSTRYPDATANLPAEAILRELCSIDDVLADLGVPDSKGDVLSDE